MNTLYKLILLCGMLASCHSDYGRRQLAHDGTNNIPIGSDIDLTEVDFYSQADLEVTNQIAKPVYFSAVFDYYQCTVSSQSKPNIEVLFLPGYIYLLSDVYQFRNCHYLEFSDIDDLEVSIPKPQFSIGQHKQFSVLRIPIKSKIECLFKMNIILNYNSKDESSLGIK